MANTFKIEKKLLLKPVSAVVKVVEPKDEERRLIVFRGGRLQSYNGTMSVSYPLPSSLLNIACAVAGRELYACLKVMREEIDIEDGPMLTIRDGKVKLGLRRLGARKMLEELAGIDPNGEWVPLKQEFMAGLEVIAGSGLSDKKSIILVTDDALVTGDNCRFTKYCQDAIQGKFTIDMKSAQSLLALGREYEEFMKQGSGTGWIHFRMGSGLVVSLRQGRAELFHEKAFNKVLEDFASACVQDGEFPDSLLRAIDCVSVISGPDPDDVFDSSVELEKVGSDLKVSASNPNGSIEMLVPWTENCTIPEGTVIRTSPAFLMRILALTRQFEFNGIKHLMFRTENMHHLLETSKWEQRLE